MYILSYILIAPVLGPPTPISPTGPLAPGSPSAQSRLPVMTDFVRCCSIY